ncbi:hypothetical protein EOI86_02990 [Hwanghaeella grinnelliae]|uniref:PAS domain-containing protein n=1 Tax=Hwanghaeella grinnelliae TaxID=2500179 RepID=A0A437QV12_9PROT|nr:hypothetical protein [Hwanghaeella grinnelliae]RVU38276.1 hypothetical protein EOI86_02990 [Hwanghaeella grinnelliae]
MTDTQPNESGMRVWKSVGEWTYTHCDPDMNPKGLENFSGLISLWQEKRQGRRVPAWRDFDFYDFKGWHGYISVYDVSYDPFDWVLRLSGTKVDELFERHLTGMTRQERNEVAIDYDSVAEFCEISCTELMLAHTRGPLNVKDKEFKWVELLELPCSDGGPRATHTIEAVVRLARDEQTHWL